MFLAAVTGSITGPIQGKYLCSASVAVYAGVNLGAFDLLNLGIFLQDEAVEGTRPERRGVMVSVRKTLTGERIAMR